MKNIFIILLIVFSANFIYSQEYFHTADEEVNNSVVNIDKTRTGSIFLGLNIGVGICYPLIVNVADTNTKVNLSLQISPSLTLMINKFIGLKIDLGVHYFKIREEDAFGFLQHNLFYAFTSFAPIVKFKRFFLFTGPYVGFLLYGKREDGFTSSTDRKQFKIIDFGLTSGFGILIGNPKFTLYYIGLEFKSQLQNFRKDNLQGSKVFAIYFNLGIIFKSNYSFL